MAVDSNIACERSVILDIDGHLKGQSVTTLDYQISKYDENLNRK